MTCPSRRKSSHTTTFGERLSFLTEYHPSLSIPAPIEEIVEFDLGIDVIPIPGLKAEIRVEAFLASDLSSLYMDENTLQFIPTRYRFSLAHEVGHWWLHDELYQDIQIASVADWRRVYGDLGDDYRWFEFQADSFAGLVLVPPASLKARFERLVGEAEAGGVRRSRLFEHPQRQRLIEKLASEFQISEQTMEIRLEKDALVSVLGAVM
jgi:Zn-dependent peptidase ImmA (M78 family)